MDVDGPLAGDDPVISTAAEIVCERELSGRAGDEHVGRVRAAADDAVGVPVAYLTGRAGENPLAALEADPVGDRVVREDASRSGPLERAQRGVEVRGSALASGRRD